jgi:hypothetical protein
MADRTDKYRQKLSETAQPHVDEPILAVGQFQPRGSAGAAGVMAGVSGLAGMIMRSSAKKNAGDLPHTGLYALTATTLHVFDVKPKGFGVKIRSKAAAIPRASFTATRGSGSVTDQLTLQFADGPTVSLESISLGASGFNDEIIDQLTAG